jgi:hypothetical protein
MLYNVVMFIKAFVEALVYSHHYTGTKAFVHVLPLM